DAVGFSGGTGVAVGVGCVLRGRANAATVERAMTPSRIAVVRLFMRVQTHEHEWRSIYRRKFSIAKAKTATPANAHIVHATSLHLRASTKATTCSTKPHRIPCAIEEVSGIRIKVA